MLMATWTPSIERGILATQPSKQEGKRLHGPASPTTRAASPCPACAEDFERDGLEGFRKTHRADQS